MFGAAKPAFGQGTSTFGGFNTSAAASPFGQSAFGKTAGGGFGTAGGGAFGVPGGSGGAQQTGLFGQTAGAAAVQSPPQQTSGLFGQPQQTGAFGAAQPQTGFVFGQNTSGGLFGNTNTGAGSTLFGQSAAQPFGAKPQGFGFGATSSAPVGGLFGSPAPSGSGLFGQPAAATPGTSGLFGSPAGFGVNTSGQTGSYIKYVPVSGSDVMVKNGHSQNVNTLHHCITCMKEYEAKSLEELRMEDYGAGRRGGGAAAAPGPFGQPSQQPAMGGGLFTQTQDKPLFGQAPNAFGQPSTSSAGGLFGKPTTTGFGAQPATGSGFSFNTSTAGQGSSLFGAAKPFSTPNVGLFGATATQAQATPFSTQPQAFGGFNTSQSSNLFGVKPGDVGATSGFGTGVLTSQGTGVGGGFGTGGSVFGAPAAGGANTGGGLFGAKPGATPFGTPAPAFGAPNTAFGAPATNTTGGGLFGNTGAFGAKPATTGAPAFGGFNPAPATNTGLGGGLNLSGGGLFGAKPPGGGLFGNTATNQPAGGLFGNSGTGLQPGGSTFNTGNTGFGTGGSLGFPTLGGGGLGTSGGGLLGGGGGGLLGGAGVGSGLNSQQPLGGSLLMGGITSPPQGGSIHEQMIALASKPFGHSQLLKDLVPSAGKVEESLKPTNPVAQKALLDGDRFRVSPGVPRLRVKPISAVTPLSKKSLFDGLEENDPSVQESLSTKRNVKRLELRRKPRDEAENNAAMPREDGEAHNDTNGRSPRNEEIRREAVDNSDIAERSSLNNTERSALEDSVNLRETSPGSNIHRRVGLSDPRGSSLRGPLQTAKGSNTSDSETDRSASWLTTRPLNKWPGGHESSSEAALDNTVDQILTWQKQTATAGSGSATKSQQGETEKIYPDLRKEGLVGNIDALDDESQEERGKENAVPHPTGIKLNRPGYYTIPSMDELVRYLKADGSCIVPQFTVGRRGYGNVFFDCEMDVAGLDLDQIVHIMNKEIVVYPEEEDKPEVGAGLNRRAQVTLDKVWPRDKTLRMPITDPEKLAMLDYEAKLRRACDKISTKFIEYRPQTGSWVFKVQHFSKYGLTESDEEDDELMDPSKRLDLAKKAALNAPKPSGLSQKPAVLPGRGLGGEIAQGLGGFTAGCDFGYGSQPSGLGGLTSPRIGYSMTDQDDQTVDGQDGLGFGMSSTKGLAMDTSEENSVDTLMLYPEGNQNSMFGTKEIVSPSSQLHGVDIRSKHTLQLMKASFYNLDNDMDEVGSVTDQLVPQGVSVAGSSITAAPCSVIMEEALVPSVESVLHSGVEIKPPIVKPQTVMLRYHKRVLPFRKTIAGRLGANCYSDLSVANARLFRVGWGRGGQLTSLTTIDAITDAPLVGDLTAVGGYVKGRTGEDTSAVVTQRLRIAGGGPPADMNITFKDSIERHLEICLSRSRVVSESPQGTTVSEDWWCPLIVPEPSAHIEAARDHLQEATRLYTSAKDQNMQFGVSFKYWKEVWSLCLALWDDHGDSDIDPSEASGARLLGDHSAFTSWLEEVNAPLMACTTSDEDDKEDYLITLLACNQVREACQQAQKDKNYFLSAMLTQIKGDVSIRALAHNQLSAFRETCSDQHMSPAFLATMALIAGRPSLPLGSGRPLHTCQDRPWTHVLALHYWYICEPIAAVSDALSAYQRSFWEDAQCEADVPMEDGEADREERDIGSAKQDDIDRSRVAYPFPPYMDSDSDTNSRKKMLDLRYQLMNLRASKWKSLDSIINPASHTPDPLDYRLSWCLHQFLEACGYSHWSPLGVWTLTTGFAAQLEAHGMWHWAVFVLQHIKDDALRSRAVREMVLRHAGGSEGSPSRELLRRLGVPSKWVHQAEALLCKYKSDWESEARHLTLAEYWTEAHQVILQHLAPAYILNENGEALRRVLQPLVKPGEDGKIPNWTCGGHLFLEFIHIWDEVKSLVGLEWKEFSYRCESLKPRIAAACSAIANLPTPTLKHTVARWEVAARLAQVGCAVVGDPESGRVTRASVRPLLAIIAALDLPPDYTRLQLDKFIQSFTESEVAC